MSEHCESCCWNLVEIRAIVLAGFLTVILGGGVGPFLVLFFTSLLCKVFYIFFEGKGGVMKAVRLIVKRGDRE